MHTPDAHAARMAEVIGATLRELRRSVASRTPVDLQGMAWDVGRLCAACLDLPPEQGRALRPRVQAVAADLDALHAALLETGP